MLRNINLIKRLIMNEIQKFKKNRMIPKGQYGLKPHEILGATVDGENVAYVNIPGKGYIAIDSKGNAYTTRNEGENGEFYRKTTFIPIKLTNYDRQHIYKAATRDNSMTGLAVNSIAKYWAAQGKPNGQPAATQKKGRRFIDKDGSEYWLGSDGSKTLLKKGTSTTSSTGNGRRDQTGVVGPKASVKGQQYWDSQYQDFLGKMTDDQKAWLAQRGVDYGSAKQMQEYLQRIGKNVGRFGADNRWGDDSQAAWNDLVNTTMKDNPLQKPIVEQPLIDAPDPFGYKTSNTYEDDNFANKLKGMGIRSNADLINFMYKSGKEGWKGDAWQTQFRSDVDRALGGDYSDANIRKVFGTQGKWGRGFMGRGDFGDFQNALQTNSGVWNGMYNAKEQASRTDANGIVYSSPEMMKKFKKIELQPNQNNQGLTSNTKFDFSNMKFNNIFTKNAGATTLGNIPSTTSINLSQGFNNLTPNIPTTLELPNTQLSDFDTSYEGLI